MCFVYQNNDVTKGTLSKRFLYPYYKDLDPLTTVNTVENIFWPIKPKQNSEKAEKLMLSGFQKYAVTYFSKPLCTSFSAF